MPAAVAGTYQQRAVVVQLAQQHAAVVKQVSRLDAAELVTPVGRQPGVQLGDDVELPGVRWLLHLRSDQTTRHRRRQIVHVSR